MGALVERRFDTVGPESISQNPSESLISALGGAPTVSGVPVTERTAEGIPAVYACDKVIKEDVARTPLKLKRRLPDGTREDDVNHPVYHALHDLANPAMTAYEFKELMQGSVNLWGEGFAEILRKRDTVELWPLEPWRMKVAIDNGRLTYEYDLGGGKKPKTWIFDPLTPPIFHLRQNARPWYRGRSPIRVLRETMGWALASQESAARFYGQGMLAAGAVHTAQKLDKTAADRVKKDLNDILAGRKNFHRIAVFDRGLEWKSIQMPAKDAEFLASLKFTRSQIAGVYRVPAHKINDLEKATFSNIEHLGIQWVGDLMPHFVMWQQAIARDLLNAKSFNTHFAFWVTAALSTADFTAMNQSLAQQRQNGVISANQWRRMLDMDDQIPADEGGDAYLVNGTMVPISEASAPDPAPAPVDPEPEPGDEDDDAGDDAAREVA
jgi:HK97 family phage portal protein